MRTLLVLENILFYFKSQFLMALVLVNYNIPWMVICLCNGMALVTLRSWVQFPGNVSSDKTCIECISAM